MSALGLRWAIVSCRDRAREWGVIGVGGGVTLVAYPDRYGRIHFVSALGRDVTEADRCVLELAGGQARAICPPDRHRRYGAGMSAHRRQLCEAIIRELNRGDDAPIPTSGA